MDRRGRKFQMVCEDQGPRDCGGCHGQKDKRSGKEQKDDVYFLQNFNRHPVKMVLNECYTNLITDEILTGSIKLQTYQCIVMQKK